MPVRGRHDICFVCRHENERYAVHRQCVGDRDARPKSTAPLVSPPRRRWARSRTSTSPPSPDRWLGAPRVHDDAQARLLVSAWAAWSRTRAVDRRWPRVRRSYRRARVTSSCVGFDYSRGSRRRTRKITDPIAAPTRKDGTHRYHSKTMRPQAEPRREKASGGVTWNSSRTNTATSMTPAPRRPPRLAKRRRRDQTDQGRNDQHHKCKIIHASSPPSSRAGAGGRLRVGNLF